MRFTDLNGVARLSPLARCTLGRWPAHYFVRIPQWSLSGAIWLGLHCLAFRCHHSSFQETPIGSVSMILIWTWMIRVTHLMMDDLMSFNFFRLITHLMPYWGIFPFRSRFIDPQWFAWSSLVARYTLGWWFGFIFFMTLRWTFSWIISSGSQFLILLWFFG